MKVFVPMTDELLNSRASSSGRLVPFDPEFLEASAGKGHMPANWISDSDYTSACRRLRNSERESKFVTV
jgi:hypothetical protein